MGINKWISSHSLLLSGWSAIITIILLPLGVLSLILGFYQIREIVTQPLVELDFIYPASVAYKVVNKSGKIAEDVLVSFGIFDLDSDSYDPVPIRSVNYEYVNKYSEKGPFSFFGSFGKIDHRYFGIVYVSCKGCKSLETYWVYVKHGSKNESFYAKRNSKDTFQINISKLKTNTEKYLEELIPQYRRVYISASSVSSSKEGVWTT